MTLHTLVAGPEEGRPVLAIHGVRGHGGRMRRFAADALPGRRVLAPDLRGHGRSTWAPPWDAAQHVADLVATLDAHGVDEPVDVVAHSFGGLLTLRLAAAHPDRVGRVALLDPAVGLPPEACAEQARVDADGEGRAAIFPDPDAIRAQWRAVRPPEGMWALEDDVRGFSEELPDGRWRLRFSRTAAVCAWSEMARPDPPALGAWRAPTALIAAAREAYVTPALRAALRAHLGAALTELAIDAGHMLYWDAPDATAALVRAHLG